MAVVKRFYRRSVPMRKIVILSLALLLAWALNAEAEPGKPGDKKGTVEGVLTKVGEHNGPKKSRLYYIMVKDEQGQTWKLYLPMKEKEEKGKVVWEVKSEYFEYVKKLKKGQRILVKWVREHWEYRWITKIEQLDKEPEAKEPKKEPKREEHAKEERKDETDPDDGCDDVSGNIVEVFELPGEDDEDLLIAVLDTGDGEISVVINREETPELFERFLDAEEGEHVWVKYQNEKDELPVVKEAKIDREPRDDADVDGDDDGKIEEIRKRRERIREKREDFRDNRGK
jgi:hypothetical protein